MRKLKDFDEDEKKNLSDELDSVAALLGHDPWESSSPTFVHNHLQDTLGICASCTHLEYCRTEFGRIYAKCGFMDIRLMGGDRMAECTKFSPRGQLSINEMKEIAIYIDIEKDNNTGFILKKKGK